MLQGYVYRKVDVLYYTVQYNTWIKEGIGSEILLQLQINGSGSRKPGVGVKERVWRSG